MEKIKFKYHPNVYDMDIFYHAEDGNFPICECCGKPTEYSYETMYSVEDVDCICPECIATGRAAEKFNGEFVQFAEDDKVNDEEKRDELYKRTPGYISWQGECWLACCNDYCEYIGGVGTEELEKMGIADEVFEDYFERNGSDCDWVRDCLADGGSLSGYLFRCLHCKKYHLGVDAD